MVHSRRCLSQQSSQWVCQLRYGADDGPFFGSDGGAFSDRALRTRQLYCRALVHASGGGRRARDCIAGCAAMSSPNQSLLSIALQYVASEDDVVAFRAHMLERLFAAEESGGGDGGDGDDDDSNGAIAASIRSALEDSCTATSNCSGDSGNTGSDNEKASAAGSTQTGVSSHTGADVAAATAETEAEASTPNTNGSNTAHASGANEPSGSNESEDSSTRNSSTTESSGTVDDAPPSSSSSYMSSSVPPRYSPTTAPSPTASEVRAAEDCVLSSIPEVRCFLYDAMTASLFHSHGDIAVVEAARTRVFHLGAAHFGLSPAALTPLWRIVEAELIMRKEKMRMLGQPMGE